MDEFQHFFDKGKQRSFGSTEWLKSLIDDVKVPLITFGLRESLLVIRCNEQLSGRFLAPAFLPRFDWLEESQRSEFVGILGAFNESMTIHFELPALDGSEMAFRIWCATGGLIGYVAKLLRSAVWDALHGNYRMITLEHLDGAFRSSISGERDAKFPVSPFSRAFMLDALQENVATALGIGVREADPEPPRRRRRVLTSSVQQALFTGAA